MNSHYDYELRYSGTYKEERIRALNLTNGKCVLCSKPATEVHHSHYTHGNDKALVNLFPLCGYHHSKDGIDTAHNPANWIIDKNPAFSRNTNKFTELLIVKSKRFIKQEIRYDLRPYKTTTNDFYIHLDLDVRFLIGLFLLTLFLVVFISLA